LEAGNFLVILHHTVTDERLQ